MPAIHVYRGMLYMECADRAAKSCTCFEGANGNTFGKLHKISKGKPNRVAVIVT